MQKLTETQDASAGCSVLDLLDHLLNQGVMLDGTLVLGVADVDLVYLRIGAVLSAVDRANERELP